MARSLRDQYDEFWAANGIRDNRPGKILDEGAMTTLEEVLRVMDESEMDDLAG
jgi:hypothetical protein